jgi:hypothetical protein
MNRMIFYFVLIFSTVVSSFAVDLLYPSKRPGSFPFVTDPYGMPGDSGGPVYQRKEKLVLIGIHIGRAMDPRMQQWINSQLQR